MTVNAIEPRSVMLSLWHGCRKLSGVRVHCYVYRGQKQNVDSEAGINFSADCRREDSPVGLHDKD